MGTKVLVIGKIAHRLMFNILFNFNELSQSDAKRSTSRSGEVRREFDGMALNIAYGLSILGSPPTIVSLVGRDFEWYFQPYFDKINLHQKVFIDLERETACNYHLTDESGNQVVISQDNCYNFIAEHELEEKLGKKDLENYSTAFVGTGKIEADVKFCTFLHQNSNIPIIYSPDNNTQEISKWRLSQLLGVISILISTESELILLESKAKQKRLDFLNQYPKLKYIVSIEDRTKIVVFSKNTKIKISDGPVTHPQTITEWEDAFRAGLIYGIANKSPIVEAAKLASSLASYYVESAGNHYFNPSIEQVQLRAYEVKTKQKELSSLLSD